MIKSIALIGMLAVAGGACGPAPDLPQDETSTEQSLAERRGHEELRAGLLAADRALERQTERLGIVEGFLRGAADDLSYLHPDQEIIEGRAATRAFLRATYPQQQLVKLAWTTASGDVSHDGSLGYSFGWTAFSARDAQGNPITQPGKYISFWRRGADRWRLIAFMRNASPEAPPPPPEGFPLLSGGRGVARWGDPDEISDRVRATDAAFAAHSVKVGYSIAFPAYTAEDGISLSAGEQMVFGRTAIAASAEGWTPEQTLDWTPVRALAAASGDLAMTTGNSVFSEKAPDGSVTHFPGKYLTVWARQRNGHWLYILDGGSARPAATP